ncbi:MAG: hypothetical protein GY940_15370 [bacterium]|nr:hypothetical protein [bacterium]
MGKQQIIEKVTQFADSIKAMLQVKMVILERLYPGEENNPDGVIDVAVVVEHLRDDEDYIQLKLDLGRLAKQIDPRIDIDIIEEERQDITGFYNEIRKTGDVIYSGF